MNFASEPGRDDGNLPPLNIVVPDDARDLDRDVLAYRREMRARRRRQRLARLSRPRQLGGHAAIIPLIAICLAVSLVGGAMLSVATMSPASAPTLSGPAASPPVAVPTGELTRLPVGSVQLGQRAVPVRSLVTAAIALVPADCGCGPQLQRLAGQASAAHVGLYFSAADQSVAELDTLTTRYGGGTAVAAADSDRVLTGTYRPVGLTVLLVFKDATADVLRELTGEFQLAPVLRRLRGTGASFTGLQPAAS
ncbi:MAG TPA: hypothetical protein VGD91_03945 [Trebonia sp.]